MTKGNIVKPHPARDEHRRATTGKKVMKFVDVKCFYCGVYGYCVYCGVCRGVSCPKVSRKFFLAVDSWGQQFSLHASKDKAKKRGMNYDGYSVLELEVGGKDVFADLSDDEEEDE